MRLLALASLAAAAATLLAGCFETPADEGAPGAPTASTTTPTREPSPEPPTPEPTAASPTPEPSPVCAPLTLVASHDAIAPGENATLEARLTNCGDATIGGNEGGCGQLLTPTLSMDGESYLILGDGPARKPLVCPAVIRYWSLEPGESRDLRVVWNGTLGNAEDPGVQPAPAGDHDVRVAVKPQGRDEAWVATVTVRVVA